MNNKGVTLVEILVSVALIALVMVFLFNILASLKTEDSLNSDRNNDSLNRATITRLIQNDLTQNKLTTVKSCTSPSGSVCLELNGNKLIVAQNYIVYKNEKWNLGSIKLDTTNYKLCKKEEKKDNEHVYSLFTLTFPYTNNDNSKRNYDFEISYVGNNIITYTSVSAKNC